MSSLPDGENQPKRERSVQLKKYVAQIKGKPVSFRYSVEARDAESGETKEATFYDSIGHDQPLSSEIHDEKARETYDVILAVDLDGVLRLGCVTPRILTILQEADDALVNRDGRTGNPRIADWFMKED